MSQSPQFGYVNVADVDEVLKLAEVWISGDCDSVASWLDVHSDSSYNQELELKADRIVDMVKDHVLAFDEGIIPVQRLFEILVPLFLKFAKTVNLAWEQSIPSSEMSRWIEQTYAFWAYPFELMLIGCIDTESLESKLLLQGRKRGAVVSCMIDGKFPEVCSTS